MCVRVMFALAAILSAAAPSTTPAVPASKIDAYVQPYVETNNFAGAVLVARNGTPIFARTYGDADRERHLPNEWHTRFHVASMSMQFTAAAALRLIDAGAMTLDTPVSAIIGDYPNGQKITVRNLLTQTSGIADINAQPDYDAILRSHQSPLSLVAAVRGVAPLRLPGTYEREEHSAYNLLALIIERKSRQPFAAAMKRLVFRPLGMNDSGIDDDSPAVKHAAAKGYAPSALYDLVAADPIHWSAKAGNGSAYTTAADELKFANALFGSKFLSPRLRNAMLNLNERVGYGWFKSTSTRFAEPVYSMNGRAPGYSSAIAYFPNERLLIVALSNIYASVPTDMAYDIAALMLGRPYEQLALKREAEARSLNGLPASFHFPKDFYQPNAVVRVTADGQQVRLHWPSGETSSLIPLDSDRYMDRSYWVRVETVRDSGGRITQLNYDRFTGERVPN